MRRRRRRKRRKRRRTISTGDFQIPRQLKNVPRYNSVVISLGKGRQRNYVIADFPLGKRLKHSMSEIPQRNNTVHQRKQNLHSTFCRHYIVQYSTIRPYCSTPSPQTISFHIHSSDHIIIFQYSVFRPYYLSIFSL